ncbi:hypothetical protein Q7P37_010804 [Cladosporium fusiforme]
MAPPEPPAEITVRVKVPPGHIAGSSADEFSLGTLPTSSRIGDLRQQIQQTLPSSPTPERQRLLYAGRALVENDQTLATALNTRRDTSQVEYVIHLLVKGEQDANGGHGASSRRSASTPGLSSAPLNPGLPQEQGTIPQAEGQLRDMSTPGLPPLPQGFGQPLHNLPHAEQIAQLHRLQQQQQHQQQFRMRQEQLHRLQQERQLLYQQEQQQRSTTAAPGRLPNAVPFAGAQLPQQASDAQAEDHTSEGQTNGENATRQTSIGDPQAQDTNGLHNQSQQPLQGPQRPISGQGFHVQGVGPDGNRFEIHQQTLNIPLPGQQPRFNIPALPGVGLPFPLPGMAQQQRAQNPPPQPSGPSALDRARQNVAEMRQMVDDMRNANATDEDRARTARLQEHIQAVNDYIDPFGVSRPNPTSRSASPFPARMAQSMRASPALGLGGLMAPPRVPSVSRAPGVPQSTRQPSSTEPNVTCYLLSSPEGPRALLISPQHGIFTGNLPRGIPTTIDLDRSVNSQRMTLDALRQQMPTPTQTANHGQDQQGQAGNAPAEDPAVAAAHQVVDQLNQAQQAQARPAAQDNPLGPMQPFLAHFWLLLRVIIFAYFILGTNMGWRRPVALALIGLGFWMIRAGLFGEGGIARRWWDGIVRVEQRPRQQPQANAEGQDGQPGDPRAGRLPTPEELAQRLVQDREQALQRAPLHRVREHLRPVERAAALFFASLWPGVGEAHVRAREAEERRQAEEEVEQRRRDEEERQRTVEAEQSGEKKEGEPSTEAAAETGEKTASEQQAVESSEVNEKQGLDSEPTLPAKTE